MKSILYCILPLCLSAPLLAQAAEGYVVADISLQAGPDTEYPAITELAAGTPVEVEGCIDGFTWCDVIAGDDRGWVAGSFIQEDYDNQRVIIEDYGPRIGIPIVAFSLGVYWDQHYHSRPFYGQRTQWEGRHIQARQPARPSAEAIRNAPRQGAPGSAHPGEHRPTPAAVPVATPAPAPVQAMRPTAPPHPEARTQPQKTAPVVERERAQPHPAPVIQQTPPHPVAETKQPPPPRNVAPVQPAPPKAAPKPKQEPKQEPKPEPKKDDGGHKDDAKDH